MNHANPIGSYLEAMNYAKQTGPQERRSHCFITISRQAGAGAHLLADAILEAARREKDERLFKGWFLFDTDMCRKILEDSKLSIPVESLVSERVLTKTEEIVLQMLSKHAPQDIAYHRIFTGIRVLANVGKVIIIGRGGACLTGNLPNGVHLRLIAPLETRVERMQGKLKLSRPDAEKAVDALDRSRAEFVRHYFGQDITDPFLYHSILNTGRTQAGNIAPLILELIRQREQKSGK